MPIPFPGNYDTLRESAGKGVAVPFHGPCLQCDSQGTFAFIGAFVNRGVVIITKTGKFEYAVWLIPLARCTNCGKWARVLPIELLPRKTYSVQVIQAAMNRYLFSECSLRKAAEGVIFSALIAVHFSTLWH